MDEGNFDEHVNWAMGQEWPTFLAAREALTKRIAENGGVLSEVDFLEGLERGVGDRLRSERRFPPQMSWALLIATPVVILFEHYRQTVFWQTFFLAFVGMAAAALLFMEGVVRSGARAILWLIVGSVGGHMLDSLQGGGKEISKVLFGGRITIIGVFALLLLLLLDGTVYHFQNVKRERRLIALKFISDYRMLLEVRVASGKCGTERRGLSSGFLVGAFLLVATAVTKSWWDTRCRRHGGGVGQSGRT